MTTIHQVIDPVQYDQLAPNARDVSNALLSRTGEAYKNGDFNSFVACLSIPSVVETFEGKNVLNTPEDVRRVFDGMRKHFDCHSITEMIRNCVSADFLDEYTIHATHETRLMNGTRLVQEPYPCFSVLRRFGNDWKVTFSSYAIVNSTRHVAALMAGSKGDTEQGTSA